MKKFSFATRLGVATSALALTCLVWNYLPRATAQGAGGSSASPAARARLAAQLNVIETFRNSLSASQRKLPSSLLLAKPGAASVRAALPKFGTSRSLQSLQKPQSVLIYGQMTARIKAAIEREGTLTGFFPESGAASALLTTTAMEHIATATEINSISFNPGPYTKRFTPSISRGVAAAMPRAGTGAIVSEGDKTHQADIARTDFKVSGAGIKIGVISDSAESLKKLQTAGELPADVKILTGQAGSGESEGTAMMEIIHDLAPDAKLEFSTSGTSPQQMAKNILALQKDGCKIIVDDIGFFSESVFQEDVVSASIRQVSALGVVYLTAIGNDGNRDIGPTSSWDGYFVDGGTARFSDGSTAILNDWNSQKDITDLVASGGGNMGATLTWADANGKSGNDYNMYEVDADNNIVNFSTTVQDGNDQPQESIYGITEGDSMLVTRPNDSKLLPMRMFLFGGDSTPTLEHSVGPTGYGHGVSEFAVSVGASPAQDPGPYPDAFSNKSTLEDFSSTGPRTLFFTPTGEAQTRLILKPDITAADNVTCATPGFAPFFGTSAAAPHAAAIAALAWSATPTASADQIKARLLKGTIDIGKAGFENDSGNGIVMAPLVLKYTDPTPTPVPTATATPRPTATPTPGPTATPIPAVAGAIAFTEPTYSVVENAGTATISVRRVVVNGQGATGAVSVSYQTTTGGTATAGTDYRTVTGTLSWASGDRTTKTFTVPIIDDKLRELNETVGLRIYDLKGSGTIQASRQTAKLTIIDDEPDSTDKIAPKVAITRPVDGSTVSNVNSIEGTVSDEGGSGIGSVVLLIQRPSDGTSWNGTEWVKGQFLLPTTLRGTAWARTSGNPPRAGVLDDFLVITAFGTDNAGNKGKASSRIFLDATPPQVSIFTPAQGVKVRTLTRANGTVSDAVGDSTLVVYLKRASDGKYWTGSGDTWSAKATPLAVQLAASGEWSRSQWPVLAAGGYSLTATGTDEVGNSASVTNSFTVGASTTSSSGGGA